VQTAQLMKQPKKYLRRKGALLKTTGMGLYVMTRVQIFREFTINIATRFSKIH